MPVKRLIEASRLGRNTKPIEGSNNPTKYKKVYLFAVYDSYPRNILTQRLLDNKQDLKP